jgi:hypothetical protein
MAKIIEVLISPTGETTVQTKGFAGSKCRQASGWLEKALGIVSSDRNTTEFHQAAETEQHVQQ